jgi:hypothetical protein
MPCRFALRTEHCLSGKYCFLLARLRFPGRDLPCDPFFSLGPRNRRRIAHEGKSNDENAALLELGEAA